MNWVLVRNTIQRLLSRPLTILVVIGYGLFVLVSVISGTEMAGGHSMQMSQSAWVLTWALGSGLLGGDRRDGYLPLLLSRPVSRAQYVASRWAGLVLCVLLVDLALHLLVALFFASKQLSPQILPLLQRWLWFCYFVPICAAWIALLSSLFSGHGDLIYFAGASLVGLYIANNLLGPEAAANLGQGLGWLWMPGKSTLEYFQAGARLFSFYSAAVFLVGAGLSLSLAAYVMQRRDVSYVNR